MPNGLNDPSRVAPEQGTMLRSLYEIEAANQEAWRLLIKVSTTIAFAHYDNKRPDAKSNLVRLRIKATERAITWRRTS